MPTNPTKSSHGFIFVALVVLVLISVATSLLHLSPGLNNTVIFIAAFAMAGLVVAQYMGLKLEGPLVLWTFIIPLALFAILVVLLLPDIAHKAIPFLNFHHL